MLIPCHSSDNYNEKILRESKEKCHKLHCSFSLQYLLSSTLDSYTNTVFFFLRGCLPSKMASKTRCKVYHTHMHCFIVSIKHLASTIIITLSDSG